MSESSIEKECSPEHLTENLTEQLAGHLTEHLISAIESATNPTDLINSVRSLANQQSLDAIPTLIKALGYNNPGAAVAAMYGLIAIGRPAVPELLTLVDGYNYGARAYTIRALAKIGDPQAVELLIHSAVYDCAPSVRRAAIKVASWRLFRKAKTWP